MVYYYCGPRGVPHRPPQRISAIERTHPIVTGGHLTKSAGTTVAVTILVAYPLAFLVQGIDFTDMGFNLSNQWLVLEDATSFSHGHLFYLANLLGGIWLALTKPLGLLGAKLGWALVLYITAYAAYRTLRGSGGQAGLLVGLIVALLWSTRIGTSWMSYNSLTAMFFVVAGCCLVSGLTRDRPWLILAAGAVLGTTPFVRLPNVLIFALVLAVPAYAYLSRRGRGWTLTNAGLFSLGFLGGVFAVVLLMYSLGHLPLYWDSLVARLTSSASDASYAYSASQLIGKLFADYFDMVLSTAIALAVLSLSAYGLTADRVWRLMTLLGLLVFGYVAYWMDLLSMRWFLSGLLVLFAFFALVTLPNRAPSMPLLQTGTVLIGTALLVSFAFNFVQANWAWVVPGLLFVALAYRYWRIVSPDERLIVIVAALILAITPLGSSNGIVNSIFGMWFAIPLAFITLFDGAHSGSSRPWYARQQPIYCVVVSASLLLIAVKHAEVATYRDSSDRARMFATIDHPYMRGALTTPERAIVVTELMNELPKFVSPGDQLLIHGGCALVHLLSRTRPVLGSTWNGVYNSRMFSEKLSKLESEGDNLPVILLSKGSCRARQWPSQLGATPTEVETRGQLATYMQNHGYVLRWQNAFFEIWTT